MRREHKYSYISHPRDTKSSMVPGISSTPGTEDVSTKSSVEFLLSHRFKHYVRACVIQSPTSRVSHTQTSVEGSCGDLFKQDVTLEKDVRLHLYLSLSLPYSSIL